MLRPNIIFAPVGDAMRVPACADRQTGANGVKNRNMVPTNVFRTGTGVMGAKAMDKETESEIKLASKMFALRLEESSQEYRAQLRDWAVMMRAAVARRRRHARTACAGAR